MRPTFSPKRTPARPASRHVRPRLEALEGRFLLSGNPTLEPAFNRVLSSIGLMSPKEIVLPDGKILVGGTATGGTFPGGYRPPGTFFSSDAIYFGQQWFALTRQIELVRFNANGTLDTSFGTGGLVIFQPGVTDTFEDFALQANGDVVVVGTNSMYAAHFEDTPSVVAGGEVLPYTLVEQDYEMVVARFNPDGSLDKSFNSGYVLTSEGGTNTYATGVAIRGNGQIVVSGQYGTDTTAGLVARYNPDGLPDTTFNPGGPQPGTVTLPLASYPAFNQGGPSALALESDGSIVVAFGTESPTLWIFRLNTDGSPDAAFGAGGEVSYAYPLNSFAELRSLTVQPDGKILVANDDLFGGLLLLRFDTDGSLDTSFGQAGAVTVSGIGPPGGQLPQTTGGVVVQPDGKIVVARASVPPTETQPALLKVYRFNADGSPDTSFGVDGESDLPFGPASPGMVIVTATAALTPDGSVVVAGSVENILSPLALNTTPYPAPPAPVLNPGQLLLVDYGDQPAPLPPATPLPVTPPVPAPVVPLAPFIRAVSEPLTQGAGTPSDAVFQSLAAGTGLQHLATPVTLPATPSATVQPFAPPIPTPLPVATPSRSAAVARLSGGGGEAVLAEVPFGITGGPETDRPLALADAAEY